MINDKTMCQATDCPLSAKCLRHEDSGVKPDLHYQSYSLFQHDKNYSCEYFIEKFEDVAEPSVSVWKV